MCCLAGCSKCSPPSGTGSGPNGSDGGTCADGSSPPCPPETEFHLHVDANRDGTVDDDRTGIDTWKWGAGNKGAIVFCNNDDDESASATDNSDQKVDAGNDGTELAPIEIRRTGPAPPADWEGSLEVTLGDSQRVHIFENNSSGSPVVMGKGKGNIFKLSDLNFTKKHLWMEATQYADSSFDGEITLTFKLKKASVLSLEEHARFRVAPWMMPNHLDSAVKVFVVQTSGVLTPAGMTDNSAFRSTLSTFVGSAGCSLQTFPSVDVWMQDCMENGYSNLPATGFRAVMRAPRNRPLKVFPKTLLTADFGYHEQGSLSPDTTFDSNGNLECTPPFTSKAGKKYPWGRIYFGPGRPGELMDSDMKAFLRKQVVQEPIEIDTNFLAVGHVDEIISFVPAPGSKGFKLLMASPHLGYKILKDNKTAHGSAKMLVGREFPEFDSSGFLVAWHTAEVSIKTFLDTGITSLAFTAASLKAFNDAAQASLDATRSKLIAELDLSAADVIDIPSLFIPNAFSPTDADALTGGMVNMLVVNKHCVVAKPFGPIVGGKDLFEEDLKKKLTPLGLTVHFIDDWYEYHVQLGEVHCATNTLRTPTATKWWEFVP